MPVAALTHDQSPDPQQHGGFQPEIQGMRALSVLAVVMAHAAVPGLGGGFIGVDVFFVISGFLITRLLLAEIERTGRIDLLAFWARRARRLLPNAFATLFGTVLLALFLFPGYDPSALAKEITHAALEIVNFHFADRAVDYFQSEGPQSPVLHFWSLAVEEQFYAVWPVLLVALIAYVRQSVVRSAALLLALVWCASFAASVILTATEQPFAYFGTPTRCWQLATGALLATGWNRVELLPAQLRAAMAWGGLAAIAAGIALLSEDRAYPGFWALLPTLGAAGVLAGFGGESPRGALRRGLSLSAMQWLGARSYSWYLWHWPLLALPRITMPDSPYIEVVAVPVSLLIASLAYRWIETPARKGAFFLAAPVPTLAAAAACLALVVGAGHLYGPLISVLHKALAARIAEVAEASKYSSQLERYTCLIENKDYKPATCLFGDSNAKRDVALFGDSHAGHWFDPIKAAAEQMGWRLQAHVKSSCPSADLKMHTRSGPFDQCNEWRESVMVQLTGENRPKAVIMSNLANFRRIEYDPTTGTRIDEEQGRKLWRDGFRKAIQRLLDVGVKVVIIADIPRADRQYRFCLIRGGVCDTKRSKALDSHRLDIDVAREFGGRVALIDFTDEFCGPETCYTRRNGRIVYRDSHHLSAGFAATYPPQMTQHLRRLAETIETKSQLTAAGTDVPNTVTVPEEYSERPDVR